MSVNVYDEVLIIVSGNFTISYTAKNRQTS